VGIALGQSKFQGRFGQGDAGRTRVLLLRPGTFMNASGEAVSAAARFFKVAPEDLLVVHDELDLSFGRLQLKRGGGTGGHNGLESIVEQLGTSEFARLRFGIGKPQGPNAKERVVGHVLHDFSAEEKELLPPLLDRAVDMARSWVFARARRGDESPQTGGEDSPPEAGAAHRCPRNRPGIWTAILPGAGSADRVNLLRPRDVWGRPSGGRACGPRSRWQWPRGRLVRTPRLRGPSTPAGHLGNVWFDTSSVTGSSVALSRGTDGHWRGSWGCGSAGGWCSGEVLVHEDTIEVQGMRFGLSFTPRYVVVHHAYLDLLLRRSDGGPVPRALVVPLWLAYHSPQLIGRRPP
jgi:PTH1 family peptidyl-tRNA hydrolase